MRWRLRRAEPADAPVLSLVASATFLDAYATVLDGIDIVEHCTRNNTIERFAAWLDDPGTMVTLAEHLPGAAPLGYSVLTAPDFPIACAEDDIELRRIYLLSSTRGAGIGHALMNRALADAQAMGHRRVLLGVWEENHVARRFYERQGFAIVGERQFQVGATLHIDPIYARAV